MTEKHYLSEIQSTEDILLAAVLLYLGYELFSITINDNGRAIIKVVISLDEFKELKNQFLTGLAVSDIRAFGKSQGNLLYMVRTARSNGDWANEELLQMARATGYTVNA